MTLKQLLLLLLLTLTAWPVMAQTTTVTGTITDPQGNPFASGTASAQKSVATGQVQPPPVNVTTNGSGTFSMSLPSPASYIFTICAAPTQIGPTGNPTPSLVCFSNVNPIAISGGSQDVSGSLNPVAKNLGPNITGVSGVVSAGTAGQLAQYAVNGNTVSGTTNVPFSYLTSFPAACPANQVAVQVGLTLGCASLTTAYLPLTGTWAFTGTLSGNYFNSGTVTNNGPVVNNAGVTSNTETVSGAANLNGGGTLAGTFSGTMTDTGTINCTIVNTIRCISPANPQLWAGSDFGAWVNSASSGYCGTIQVAAGTYSFATQINKPRCINLTGQYGGTTLTWTGSGSTAMIVVHDALGTASYLKGGVSNFFMQGPGAGGSTIALYCGGDPAGVLAPTGDFCDMQDNYNNTITNFGVGLKFGNNAFFIYTYSVIDYANGKGIIYPSGLTNSGEALVFVGGAVGNNTGTGLQNDGGGLFKFWSTSFDFNTPQWNGTSLNAECRGCHFENNIGTQIDGTSGLTITIDGGEMFGDQASGTDTQWIIVSSASANGLVFQNVNISSNHNVTQLVNWTGTTPNPVLRMSGLSGNGNGKVLALTNTLTPFTGESIHVNVPGINAVDIEPAVAVVIARGSQALGTGSIAAGGCATTGVSVANVLTTDKLTVTPNAAPAANYGSLNLSNSYLTVGGVQLTVCNPTVGALVPGATTVNYLVTR